jgi:hypothetical protein
MAIMQNAVVQMAVSGRKIKKYVAKMVTIWNMIVILGLIHNYAVAQTVVKVQMVLVAKMDLHTIGGQAGKMLIMRFVGFVR